MMQMPGVSVVIPALNEEDFIRSSVRSAMEADEVVVVDGGSRDRTVARALDVGAMVITSPRGRGTQLNAGAVAAGGSVLVFLHADTVLPPGWCQRIREAHAGDDSCVRIFRSQFDPSTPALRFFSFFTRFESPLTTFGDQCLVVSKDAFMRLGGFPDWPLFEDVRFLGKARRSNGVRRLPLTVTTSARTLLREGILRRQAKNVLLLMLYACGVSPHVLASRYYGWKEEGDGAAENHLRGGAPVAPEWRDSPR
jgi:rSAM/selenodomain-associated transferase 2